MNRFLYLVAGFALAAGRLFAEPVAIPELQEARERNIEQMELGKALDMLVATLGETGDNGVRESLLRGMLLGLEGRNEIAAPRDWPKLNRELSEKGSDAVKKLAQELAQLFGDEGAVAKAFALLKDAASPAQDRRRALAGLLSRQNADLLPVLKNLLGEPALRVAAIRAYGSFESPEAPAILLQRYPGFSPEERRAVIETLATRKSYAQALLGALDAGTVSREAVPAYVDRSLAALLGERYVKKYGGTRISRDKDAEIAKYAALASAEALARADASRGRAVFQKACLACHQMYGEGGAIGPDLTGSNRADLNYLLLNILYPEFDIPDAYRMVVVTTRDGQVLTGIVAEEDDQKLVLKTVAQPVTIAKSGIGKRETVPASMMPPGLLLTLKNEEIIDLIKYCQTKEQVALP